MPVAKAKKKSKDAAAQRALDEHEAMINERYEYALEIKKQQDDKTIVAINRMVARMQALAGPPTFYFGGISVPGDPERMKTIQIRSLTWFAIRLFVACAEWGIKIENFKLPTKHCAKCGKKVKRA